MINHKVINNPDNALFLFLLIKAWWLYVIVAPDDNKIIVFNKGNSVGLITSIPIGGQQLPNRISGLIAIWKYTQNKLAKINTSDNTNNKNPILIPFLTAIVWLPKYVASAIISLNQKHVLHTNTNNAKYTIFILLIYPCIVNPNDNANDNNDNDTINGHGDGITIWYGYNWCLPLSKCVILTYYLINNL